MVKVNIDKQGIQNTEQEIGITIAQKPQQNKTKQGNNSLDILYSYSSMVKYNKTKHNIMLIRHLLG